jgi:hypothetical protein
MNGSSQLESTRGVLKVMLIWYCFALKLTVVLDYYEAIETYSRIELIRSYEASFNGAALRRPTYYHYDRSVVYLFLMLLFK